MNSRPATLMLGVNYHPSRTGCSWLTEFDEQAMAADFARMAAAGLTAVRLFVFWRDVMPAHDQVDRTTLDRIDRTVAAAGTAGLGCVLSLLTIWMNGQRLDLPWRAGRSLVRDADMLAAEHRYLAAVADAVRDRPNVLAFDLGDELWQIDPGQIDPGQVGALSRREVAAWCAALAATIRSAYPGALVMQANEATAAFGGTPYDCSNTAGLDLIGIHGFPPWSPGGIESTLSYKATNLPGYLAGTASAYRAAIVDELGSYGVNDATAAGFLGAAAASALLNGATGIFVWCWQDIAATAAPYRQRPAERNAGLHRLDGTPKATMAAYRSVIARAGDLAGIRRPARIALLLTGRDSAAARDSPDATGPDTAGPDTAGPDTAGGPSYLDVPAGSVAPLHAYLLLKRAHLAFDMVADPTRGRHDLVICPAPTLLTIDDLDRLHALVERGATVYLSLGDHLHAMPDHALTGAEIVDFRLADPGKSAIRWHQRRQRPSQHEGRAGRRPSQHDGDPLAQDPLPLHWPQGTVPTTMVATTAEVLATYPDTTPAVVANRVGHGRFLFTNAPVELQFDVPGRLTATAWHTFYQRIAALAGLRPPVSCPEPDLEIVAGAEGIAVVNHGERPISTTMAGEGWQRAVTLTAKQWTILPNRPLPNQARPNRTPPSRTEAAP